MLTQSPATGAIVFIFNFKLKKKKRKCLERYSDGIKKVPYIVRINWVFTVY